MESKPNLIKAVLRWRSDLAEFQNAIDALDMGIVKVSKGTSDTW